MKKIIVISSLILILTLFNYPVFDSENISYSIIFLCFVAICFSGAKIYFPSDTDDYKSVEKEMDRLYESDGIFKYTNDGFYIRQKKSTEFIKWKEIVAVNTFLIPDFIYKKQSVLEIITDNKSFELNHQGTPGIEKLVNVLYNHLPTWELDSPTLIVNNSGSEKTKLYERQN